MNEDQTMKRRCPNRRAFTLIELLLVMVILVVLAAIVLPRFTGRSEEAKLKAAKTQISMLDTALDLFENDNGRMPSSDEGLSALIQAPSGATDWKGPYMKQGIPNDPWSRPYVYRYPGERNANGADLYSIGPDGQEGTADDIGNWTN
jgi:general secretion pathway protein G